jgi:hypothetical protein
MLFPTRDAIEVASLAKFFAGEREEGCIADACAEQVPL